MIIKFAIGIGISLIYYIYIFTSISKTEIYNKTSGVNNSNIELNNINKKEPSSVISSSLNKDKNIKHINFTEFSKNENKWVIKNAEPQDETYVTHFFLSLITYNIWFDRYNWNNRVVEIIKLIETYFSDFVCLQEVTKPFIDILKKNEFIKENYILSANKIQANEYDVLILFKKNFKNSIKLYSVDFPSRMGRKLLLAELIVKKDNFYKTIIIGTSHFESLYQNYKYREVQLKQAFNILDKYNFSLLVGDFNFDAIFNKNEMKSINETKYQDAWLQYVSMKKLIGEEAKGITFPQEDDIPPTRLDRVYYTKNNGLDLEEFVIIGKDPINIDKVQRNSPNNYVNEVNTPSDHNGIYVKFNINQI